MRLEEELASLRKQLTQGGPAQLASVESRLQQLSVDLHSANSLDLAAIRRELSQLLTVLDAAQSWCGDLAQLLSCQTDGYGAPQNLRSNRVQVVG